MADIAREVKKNFGNKVRVRVCGICLQQNQVLLINHRGLGKSDQFWAPPGGGIDFGESATETLQREFAEETGLQIDIGRFLFMNEFIASQLHAIEIFFEVHILAGELHKGTDPELRADEQIIKDVKFMSLQELQQYQSAEMHSIFHHCQDLQEILQRNGYICAKGAY